MTRMPISLQMQNKHVMLTILLVVQCVASAVAFSFSAPHQSRISSFDCALSNSHGHALKLKTVQHRKVCLTLLKASEEADDLSKSEEKSRKDAVLRKLALSDAPKSSPKPPTNKEPELPTWVYFAVPISGALLALGLQIFTSKPLPIG